MKSKILFVALLWSVLFSACSSDEEVVNSKSADLTSNPTITVNRGGGGLGNYLDCVNAYACTNLVNIRTGRPIGNNEILVVYNASMTLEEIECTRRSYFHCIEELKMNEQQPDNIRIDSWLLPLWKPSQSTTETINEDPRVTNGDNTGG